MRYHKRGVRAVDFSPRYPLFASASDDGSVIVSHGMVYNDLLQNPLIVPVKILRGHEVVQSVGVTDCKFHPNQPWLLSSGADKTIRQTRGEGLFPQFVTLAIHREIHGQEQDDD